MVQGKSQLYKINAEEALKDQNSIFYYYKKLIRFRKEEPILIYGTFELLCPEDEHVFAYTREWKGKKWLVVGNFYEKSARLITLERQGAPVQL